MMKITIIVFVIEPFWYEMGRRNILGLRDSKHRKFKRRSAWKSRPISRRKNEKVLKKFKKEK